MSAFLVSERHINTLVSWAANHRLIPASRPHLADLARMLVAENVRSLAHRYEDVSCDRIVAATYAFKRVSSKVRATQIVKACDCYDYQCCESDDYDNTDAARFVDSIRAAAVTRQGQTAGRDYDAAAWEIV